MTLSRRSLITGLVSLVASPAIVRAGSLMPVKAFDPEWVDPRIVEAFMGTPTIFPPEAFRYRAEFISAVENYCDRLTDWFPVEPVLRRPGDASGYILELYEDAVRADQS